MMRLVRSTLATSAATLTDLGTLFLLVTLLGVDPRVASVPSLVLAGIVNFVANRRYAFRAEGGNLGRQAVLFALVQLVSISLGAALFELGLRALDHRTAWYWALRLVVSAVVYLVWSFPMFRRVFAPSSITSASRSTPLLTCRSSTDSIRL